MSTRVRHLRDPYADDNEGEAEDEGKDAEHEQRNVEARAGLAAPLPAGDGLLSLSGSDGPGRGDRGKGGVPPARHLSLFFFSLLSLGLIEDGTTAGGGSRRCVDVGALSSEKTCRMVEAQCVEKNVISRDATAAPR